VVFSLLPSTRYLPRLSMGLSKAALARKRRAANLVNLPRPAPAVLPSINLLDSDSDDSRSNSDGDDGDNELDEGEQEEAQGVRGRTERTPIDEIGEEVRSVRSCSGGCVLTIVRLAVLGQRRWYK
jgi:hypothetical protein